MHCWWCGWLSMFFSFPSHNLPALSLSIHPNYADSVSSEEQIYLSASYLDQTLKISLSCCTIGLLLTFIPQEDATEEQSTNEPILKIFVVMIWLNSWGYQVQRCRVIMGKWCLCTLYLRLEKRPNNRLAFCCYETIPMVFICQNTEEV